MQTDAINDYWQWGVAMSFCINHGITITPVIVGRDMLKICVNDNGKEKVGEKIYNHQEYFDKVKELYLLLKNRYIEKNNSL